MLRTISKEASKILDKLVEGVTYSTPKKVENSTIFMPVSVNQVGENLFSVAHTHTQNGDLMSDPDMVFFRNTEGEWMPVSFQQDNLGIYRRVLEFEKGVPSQCTRGHYADLCSFTNTWMWNIKRQQSL